MGIDDIVTLITLLIKYGKYIGVPKTTARFGDSWEDSQASEYSRIASIYQCKDIKYSQQKELTRD